jgi:hypothetical protein
MLRTGSKLSFVQLVPRLTIKEGLREGLKKAILLDAEAKFGLSEAKRIKNILDKINDTTRLEKIKREIIKAKTWENFVKSIKNSNSKNKI